MVANTLTYEASDYLFICVGTPAAPDGSADLQYVMSVAGHGSGVRVLSL